MNTFFFCNPHPISISPNEFYDWDIFLLCGLRVSVDSLASRKIEWNFRHVIFRQILVIDGWGISCEITLMWMSLNFTNDQAKLVQVMAWCRQTTSHYLSQCWPRSLSPYGVTRPQWINSLAHRGCGSNFEITIFKHIVQNNNLSTCCEISLKWMPQNITNEKSTSV